MHFCCIVVVWFIVQVGIIKQVMDIISVHGEGVVVRR